MIRAALLLALCCVAIPAHVEARPSPYRADTFAGDRYVSVAQGMNADELLRAPKRKHPTKHKQPRKRKPGSVAPLTMAGGAWREVERATDTASHFIRGRLICAVNVGQELARRGIKGTGSRLAKSYLSWGRASGPVGGAVAVFNRKHGGHVAIVDHVRPDGTVIYRNPSARRQAWVIGPYRKRPIAYRVAS